MHHLSKFNKIVGTIIDDAKDLDGVMPRYYLLEYSSNNFDTTGSLWFYSKDKATKFDADIPNTDFFELFKYKTVADGNHSILKNATIAAPVKYLGNFCDQLKNY